MHWTDANCSDTACLWWKLSMQLEHFGLCLYFIPIIIPTSLCESKRNRSKRIHWNRPALEKTCFMASTTSNMCECYILGIRGGASFDTRWKPAFSRPLASMCENAGRLPASTRGKTMTAEVAVKCSFRNLNHGTLHRSLSIYDFLAWNFNRPFFPFSPFPPFLLFKLLFLCLFIQLWKW